jgi:long-chain acyl-CoA synthetase
MESLPRFFEKYVEENKTRPLLWEKTNGKYESTSYETFREKVHQFAAGLKAIGIEKEDRIALLSEGRNDWLMSELGILYVGAVSVPLSTKLNEDRELIFRLTHSETSTIIVSRQQYPKIQRIRKHIPGITRIILLDTIETKAKDIIFKEQVLHSGREYLAKDRETFTKLWQSIQPDAFANISYTSGTTADPKGIVLTHSNYTANTEQGSGLMEIPKDYIIFIVLPWDHSFAHTAGLYTIIRKGASIASVELGNSPMETLRNIPKNMKEIKPHLMLSVPSLAKNFKKNIENAIRKKGPTIEKMFNKALEVAYAYNREGYNKGVGKGQWLRKLQYKFYDYLLFRKIRENFGGRMQFFIGGGALLDIDLQRFFYAIGVPMFQGYGLSESSPIISSNATHAHKLGSSGKLVKDMELIIVDDDGMPLPTGRKGEIVIKGPNVMHSYWKNEKATAATIKNGWLYTGDLGYMDEDGYLYVLGRFKSLLISSDGEKYSPEGIEETLTEHSPFVEQIMLHNNQDPYTIALIYPNKEYLRRKATEKGIDVNKESGLKALLQEMQKEIDSYAAGKNGGIFPERWMPTAIGILEEGFTEENKMMNSTMKIVRSAITEAYADKIEKLYTPEGKSITHADNIHVMKKLLVTSKVSTLA